ncbi:hypothetical protein DFH08DRAFT_810182 [Mycena albidolilacea]|uniref:Uncharacterized protein n=1 Tax=Mycena albidolilacea TaxID=1033008 RepID=A0AAD7ERS6_9AGAR|nr:hypothetical protein DFH08DRAFT_810182 [Mycena albidolilacea]
MLGTEGKQDGHCSSKDTPPPTPPSLYTVLGHSTLYLNPRPTSQPIICTFPGLRPKKYYGPFEECPWVDVLGGDTHLGGRVGRQGWVAWQRADCRQVDPDPHRGWGGPPYLGHDNSELAYMVTRPWNVEREYNSSWKHRELVLVEYGSLLPQYPSSDPH